MRIYIITKFLEEADTSGPEKITEPGVHLFISIFAPAEEPESEQGRTPYLLKSKTIRDFPETAHIVELQREWPGSASCNVVGKSIALAIRERPFEKGTTMVGVKRGQGGWVNYDGGKEKRG